MPSHTPAVAFICALWHTSVGGADAPTQQPHPGETTGGRGRVGRGARAPSLARALTAALADCDRDIRCRRSSESFALNFRVGKYVDRNMDGYPFADGVEAGRQGSVWRHEPGVHGEPNRVCTPEPAAAKLFLNPSPTAIFAQAKACLWEAVQHGPAANRNVAAQNSQAVVKITTAELYQANGVPKEGGLVDPKMGTLDKKMTCQTCFAVKYEECPGHFGANSAGGRAPFYCAPLSSDVHAGYTRGRCSRITRERACA